MIYIVVLLLIISLNSVLGYVDEVDDLVYLVNRITDCFLINDNIESVELVCDKIGGNYPKNKCYSTLFESESQEINRK